MQNLEITARIKMALGVVLHAYVQGRTHDNTYSKLTSPNSITDEATSLFILNYWISSWWKNDQLGNHHTSVVKNNDDTGVIQWTPSIVKISIENHVKFENLKWNKNFQQIT